MFKRKVTQEEFEGITERLSEEILAVRRCLNDTIAEKQDLKDQLTALYNHLGLEYFEEETSGVREKNLGKVICEMRYAMAEDKPKKRSKKKKTNE